MTTITGLVIILHLFFPASPSFAGDNPGTWRNPKDGMVFVWIPAGSLMVQVPKVGDKPDVELPFEPVVFERGFWMGRTEVTVRQFKQFVRETGYITEAEKAQNRYTWKSPGFKQKDSYPVVYVSYHDALQYTKWAGTDLPTEPEWVYACSAGTTTTYYWGDELNPDLFWHRENSLAGPHPVGKKKPNPWGLYDMVGNAWEYFKIDDKWFEFRGGSWTRCLRYKTRQGFIADQFFKDAVSRRLFTYDPKGQLPYPWDDDRGFRCIMRSAEASNK
ncbi:formylglycine-generating enzyme family protein [bacterium]|nr:formylglycine-generating enzyme family protein [bacterium]